MRRKTVALLAITILLAFGISHVFADAELVQLNSPIEGKVYNEAYILSGKAPEGTLIKVKLNDELIFEWAVGPSGFFVKTVDLQKGINKIQITAEKDDQIQVLEGEVLLAKRSWGDILNQIFIKDLKGIIDYITAK